MKHDLSTLSIHDTITMAAVGPASQLSDKTEEVPFFKIQLSKAGGKSQSHCGMIGSCSVALFAQPDILE
jgi:hypothetical protein